MRSSKHSVAGGRVYAVERGGEAGVPRAPRRRRRRARARLQPRARAPARQHQRRVRVAQRTRYHLGRFANYY